MAGHREVLQAFLDALPPDVSSMLEQPGMLAGLLVGIVTLLVLLVMLIIRSAAGGRGGAPVVVAGPCNAGKTTLFFQLRDGSTHLGTVASMQENSSSVRVKIQGRDAGSVLLADIPGHERLRHQLDQYLKKAAAVVFVVDAADITPHKVEAAEELFEVLTHPSIAKRKVPILIACNKMDLPEAHSVDFVRRIIERQLDSMRKTRTTLSPDAAHKAAVLGKPDKPFVLSGLRNPISVVGVSAGHPDKSVDGGWEQLQAFLKPLAR